MTVSGANRSDAAQDLILDLTQFSVLNLYDKIHFSLTLTSVLVGIPLNGYVFARLLKTKRHFSESRMFLLHLQLNASDLLVLTFCALFQTLWLLSTWWPLGDFLCKLMKFMEFLSFAVSSNVLVCIAANRLYSLQQPLRVCSFARGS